MIPHKKLLRLRVREYEEEAKASRKAARQWLYRMLVGGTFSKVVSCRARAAEWVRAARWEERQAKALRKELEAAR